MYSFLLIVYVQQTMAGDEVADLKSCVVAKHDLKVGLRVSSLNTEKGPQFGTVKFIGNVNGFQGIWVGVDWDNGQGRHDGKVDGVHYFDTSGDKSGSFVRPHTLSTGVSLLDALTCKYRANSTANEKPGMFYQLWAHSFALSNVVFPLAFLCHYVDPFHSKSCDDPFILT